VVLEINTHPPYSTGKEGRNKIKKENREKERKMMKRKHLNENDKIKVCVSTVNYVCRAVLNMGSNPVHVYHYCVLCTEVAYNRPIPLPRMYVFSIPNWRDAEDQASEG
jgi:hypothetical protein